MALEENVINNNLKIIIQTSKMWRQWQKVDKCTHIFFFLRGQSTATNVISNKEKYILFFEYRLIILFKCYMPF